MRSPLSLIALAALLVLALPLAGSAGQQSGEMPQPTLASVSLPEDAPAPSIDPVLVREHESFSSFARAQVERMNATILGGRHSMRVRKGSDGLYHASFRAINLPGVVCQVRRSESNPHFYVGNLIYKEQVLESVGKTAEACRKGPFEPVSEKANRLIYTSGRGGGWR